MITTREALGITEERFKEFTQIIFKLAEIKTKSGIIKALENMNDLTLREKITVAMFIGWLTAQYEQVIE